MKNTAEHCDVVIAGAGLAGLSLALALLQAGFSIRVVERMSEESVLGGSLTRTVVVSHTSMLALCALGIWSELQDHAQIIKTIHVSEQANIGMVRLSSKVLGVPALGYVLPNVLLQRSLYQAIQAIEANTVLFESEVADFQSDTKAVTLTIAGQNQQKFSAKLLVAAEGVRSPIRQQLQANMVCGVTDQIALATTVSVSRPTEQVAYERFTHAGPIAFLPLGSDQYSVVCSLRSEQAEALQDKYRKDFLGFLQHAFGYRLGQIQEISTVQSFPITAQYAEYLVHDRVVLLGNAAHNLHPVAGQGFNLTLRDVAQLAECLLDYQDGGANIEEALSLYQQLRLEDIRHTYQFTERLIRGFADSNAPMRGARGAGLLALDWLPGFKQQFVRFAIGERQNAPRLMRGVSVDLKKAEHAARLS